jgi:hypothetical protein
MDEVNEVKEVKDDVKDEVKDDVKDEVDESIPGEVSEKKLTQLKLARDSASKKRQRRVDDLSAMNDKLDTLVESAKKQKTEEHAKPDKIVVTKLKQAVEPEAEVEVEAPTMFQAAFKTGAILLLGGASFYMQHVYGKQAPVRVPKAATAPPPAAPVLQKKASKLLPFQAASKMVSVGRSGFVI